MPSISVYITDEIYLFLSKKGKPSSVVNTWIKERYEEEIEKEIAAMSDEMKKNRR